MADDSHAEVLEEFRAVTGANADRAKFYLESANWNIQVRLLRSSNKRMDAERSNSWIRRFVRMRKTASHINVWFVYGSVCVCLCVYTISQ